MTKIKREMTVSSTHPNTSGKKLKIANGKQKWLAVLYQKAKMQVRFELGHFTNK